MATDSLVLQKEFGQGVNRSTITQAGSEFNIEVTLLHSTFKLQEINTNEIYHIWLEYLVVLVFLNLKAPCLF